MPGHLARIVLAIVMLLSATTTHAQQEAPARVGVQIIGDGAAECAAAKQAAAAARAARHRPEYSLASANFDATFYHLDLFVGMDDDSIAGVVRVEGRVTGSPMTQLTLDLAPSMLVTSVELAGGGTLAFTHPGAALNITLPSTQSVGSLVAVDVTYRGKPVADGFGNFVFGTRTITGVDYGRFAWSLSEPYGAREWWPCKDHPSDKADSVRVTVTVPSQYRVGSQGLLLAETPVGSNTVYDWLSHYPISSYLVSVAIGEYVRFQDTYVRPVALEADYGPLSLPLDHLRYDDNDPALPSGWMATADVLEVLESWFGPYPFANEKYGHSEFTFSGGMEHQTMTSLGTGAVSIVAHEAAHQWYGDSITPRRWEDLWLNEGFATYAELLYFGERDSLYQGTYEAVFDSRYRSAKRATGTLVLQDTTSVNNMFDGNRVYAKGAMVLYMLHHVVGDAVFKDILKTYAADPAVQYGNATTADFQRVAQDVSGMDLDAFFRQWVTTGTGYPTYAASSSWTRVAGGYDVTVQIAQQQTQPQSNWSAFDMPVEIAVVAESPSTTTEVHRERVRNYLRSQTFSFNVALPDSFQIAFVRVDPDRRILRSEYVNPIPDTPSIPVISSVSPNPTSGAAQVRFTLDTASTVELNLFDVGGRRVLTQTVAGEIGPGVADIDTSRLASGVYFLRLSTARGAAKTKFVVVR
jgi:aminopeptidase N